MQRIVLPSIPNGSTVENSASLHLLHTQEVFSLTSSRREGLTEEEALRKMKQHGPNIIQQQQAKPLWIRFVANFTHLMAILLWVGGAVAFVAQTPQLGYVIWAVNVINGFFSFWQEFKANKATEALRKLLPSYARVIRGNMKVRIMASDLVIGDVVCFEEGDKVSADSYLIESSELYIDQSTFTGESAPVSKSPSAAGEEEDKDEIGSNDFSNLLYAGTTITSGTGMGIVYSTGMATRLGQIAHLTQSFQEQLSPIQKEMEYVTKIIAKLASGIGILIFFLSFL